MDASGVTPAVRSNDYEFIRRVTLDLTGRIPAVDRLLTFTADSLPAKRAALIDELLNRPEWTDKWTMYFGDLFRNSANLRGPLGRNAFYQWIKSSIAANRPYDQIVRE